MKKIILLLCFVNSLVYGQLNLLVIANNTVCAGTATGTVTGYTNGGVPPYSYCLVSQGLNCLTFASNNIFTELPAGNYKMTVKDQNNDFDEKEFTINQATPLIVTPTVSGTTVVLSGTGGSAPYEYSVDGGQFSSISAFAGLTPGGHYGQVKDFFGCVSSISFGINITQPLSFTVSTTNNACFGDANGSITVTPTGGSGTYGYAYYREDGTSTGAGFGNGTLSSLSARTYQIVVYDNANNSETQFVTIEEPSKLLCFPNVNGTSVAINSSGGALTSSRTYSLDGNQWTSSGLFNNLTIGQHSARVKDGNGCISDTAYFDIISNLILTFGPIPNINCFGDNNSYASVTASGGTPPYTITFNGGVNNGIVTYNFTNPVTVNNLRAGICSFSVTDANNYNKIVYFEISQPTQLFYNSSINGTTLTINGIGGIPPYQYAINNTQVFQSSNIFYNISTTQSSNTFYIKDVNGCVVPFLLVYIPSAANGVPSGSTQTFPAGSTLANVAMNGNVIWYSSATGGGRNVASILPLSTVLVNGASYFAAQVVNGQESQDRYELVVAISALANEKFSFKNLSYSPNPVSNILNVSNNSIISSIEITSLLGQSVMYKKTNSLQSEIDLTNLSKGIYIMKVSSEGSEKTVKIVKD